MGGKAGRIPRDRARGIGPRAVAVARMPESTESGADRAAGHTDLTEMATDSEPVRGQGGA